MCRSPRLFPHNFTQPSKPVSCPCKSRRPQPIICCLGLPITSAHSTPPRTCSPVENHRQHHGGHPACPNDGRPERSIGRCKHLSRPPSTHVQLPYPMRITCFTTSLLTPAPVSLLQQDHSAAKALVSANKPPATSSLQTQPQSQPRGVPTQSSPASPSASRRGTDRLGRSIFTPPMSRTNSATPASNPGTPRTEVSSSTARQQPFGRRILMSSIFSGRRRRRRQGFHSPVTAPNSQQDQGTGQ